MHLNHRAAPDGQAPLTAVLQRALGQRNGRKARCVRDVLRVVPQAHSAMAVGEDSLKTLHLGEVGNPHDMTEAPRRSVLNRRYT